MNPEIMPEGLVEFHNSYLHLMVDKETKLLYSQWTRKPNSAEYREATGILADHIMGEGLSTGYRIPTAWVICLQMICYG